MKKSLLLILLIVALAVVAYLLFEKTDTLPEDAEMLGGQSCETAQECLPFTSCMIPEDENCSNTPACVDGMCTCLEICE